MMKRKNLGACSWYTPAMYSIRDDNLPIIISTWQSFKGLMMVWKPSIS